jgi:hypothetical protein
LSRLLHILALLPALLYASPLKACIVQEWTAGFSCHDLDAAAGGVLGGDATPIAPDGCVPHPEGGETEDCICEVESPTPSGQSSPVHLDAPDPLSVTASFIMPVAVGEAPPRSLRPPGSCCPTVSLPLLN